MLFRSPNATPLVWLGVSPHAPYSVSDALFTAVAELATDLQLPLATHIAESEDDELAYAYYAANENAGPYDRATANRAYARRAYAVYRRPHIERGLAMAFKAIGLDPQGRLHRLATSLAWTFIRSRARRLARHRQITACNQLTPCRSGHAFNRCNHRLGQGHDRLHHLRT